MRFGLPLVAAIHDELAGFPQIDVDIHRFARGDPELSEGASDARGAGVSDCCTVLPEPERRYVTLGIDVGRQLFTAR